MDKRNGTALRTSSHSTFGISDEVTYIFAWVVFGVVCQVVGVFGVTTNIINIICFFKQDFKDSINICLLGLAISDLGCLSTQIGSNIMFTPAVMTADLPFNPIELTYMLFATPHVTFSRVSSWITATITLERCLCIIAPLQIQTIVTPRRTTVVIVSVMSILIFCVAPVYAFKRLDMVFSSQRNKTILGIIFLEDPDDVEKTSIAVNNFGIPLTAFVIIVVCTITLVWKLRSATRWRHTSSTNTQVDRVSRRNQKVAKMVVMISTLFITCFIPVCAVLLAMSLEPALFLNGEHLNIGIVLGGIGFVLESINSSVNIFIYYQMSTKYRNAFKEVFLLKKKKVMNI